LSKYLPWQACISYNAPPTSQKRAADHWSLWNLSRSSLFTLEKPRNCMGHDLNCMADVLMGFHRSTFSKPNTELNSDLAPMRFMGFSNHKKGTPRQEISKWSTVCSTFSWRGWSVVRRASLAKGGTSKKRPSPHLHKVSTRSNKVSPRTLQTVLVLWISESANRTTWRSFPSGSPSVVLCRSPTKRYNEIR
jgi:hypothetical protein